MADLVLYQRDYCHLCDQALAVLAEARAPDFDSVWVDDHADLEQRYGTRVPVLLDLRDGRELDWPFDAAAVSRWIGLGRNLDSRHSRESGNPP
ncbi:glutaredoxin family protein [Dyella caseinilytica]|uniref:Glutaredoxin family protein n=1 Tax=Dyella caseinilytica TaxID=1849581 RepID=A0ABX7GQX5_9GAMM|nr:glutaredoxin family protein [Dyella caseinilytica]QRN52825.1 glutaredoxin family protein [Dyella caseinilytica]GGA09036.1 NrdH-redoxin [Dyella caseinilytica]